MVEVTGSRPVIRSLKGALGQLAELVAAIANAGAGDRNIGWGRQLRSELQQISAVRVADLRAEADQIAESRRKLDVRIQQAGWSTELLD